MKIVIIVNCYTNDSSTNLKLLKDYLEKKRLQYKIISFLEECKNLQSQNIKSIIFTGSSLDALKFNYKSEKKIKLIWMLSLLYLEIPKLYICYSHEILCSLFGSRIHKLKTRQRDKKTITFVNKHWLFKGIETNQSFKTNHIGYIEYKDIPQNFTVIAKDENNIVYACADNKRQMYSLQMHVEGMKETHIVLDNFFGI